MEGKIPSGRRDSAGGPAPPLNPPPALLMLFCMALAVGASGCVAALPVLSAIPSAISLVYDAFSGKSGADSGADAKPQDAGAPAVDANAAAQKLTPQNFCHMLALERPNLVVAQLRKGAAGAPEYRELHLVKSADGAHWSPIAGGETGPSGWRPAVNFEQMNFNPPLTGLIPPSGTAYLAYVPTKIASDDPVDAAGLKAKLGNAAGEFSWNGRIYEFTVARTLPCLSPPAGQSAALSDAARAGPNSTR
ncbi:MAG: hypothetical protein ACREQI_07720 [Candidatus Binataceae bacterium]